MIYGMDEFYIGGLILIYVGIGLTYGVIVGFIYRVFWPLVRAKGREGKEIQFVK